ncbi:MAG: GAF domain-containing SpoIIE family protein phosphatase [Armatimonadota bacterium]
MAVPKLPSEKERLAALRSFDILDSESEEAFDDITRLVAHVCQVPIALITLIDEERQFFKSEIGLGVRETPRDISICGHAILQKGLFVVADTLQDERFVNNPLVTGDPHLRFYAGALLETAEGHPLGTLCVLDYETRELTSDQKSALQTLARHVMHLMELRRRYNHEKRIAETLQRAMLLRPSEGQFPGLEVEPIYEAAWSEAEVGGDFYDAFALPSGEVALVVGDVAGKGLAAAARSAEVKYALRVYLRESPSPSEAITRLNHFLCDVQRIDSRMGDAFVALAAAVIDPSTGQTRITQAGLEPPLVRRAGGAVETVEQGAMPLGISGDAVYRDETITLAQGDLLLLLTDGITESRQGREFFGFDGVERVLRTVYAERPLADAPALPTIGNRIVDEARAFGGTLRDDVCLFLARLEPVNTAG